MNKIVKITATAALLNGTLSPFGPHGTPIGRCFNRTSMPAVCARQLFASSSAAGRPSACSAGSSD